MTRQVPTALSGTTFVELVRPGAPRVTRVAIAFAGRLAASLGGRVLRLLPDGEDPMAGWGPLLPDGSSALHRFLNPGKETVRDLPAGPAELVTDDPGRAAAWTAGSTVLLRGSRSAAGAPESELTILAASGLLDVFGEAGRPPLPLPGHQVAYAAGTAAFNVLVCAAFQRLGGRGPLHGSVPLLDVAVWLNWKHWLAAFLGQPAAGIGRAEEWTTYRCLDGYVAVIFQDKDLPKLAELAGEPRLSQPCFASRESRRTHLDAFRGIIARWTGTRTREQIVAEARRLGIPIGPVLSLGELLDDRQMRARAFIDLASDSPQFGAPRLPAVIRTAA